MLLDESHPCCMWDGTQWGLARSVVCRVVCGVVCRVVCGVVCGVHIGAHSGIPYELSCQLDKAGCTAPQIQAVPSCLTELVKPDVAGFPPQPPREQTLAFPYPLPVESIPSSSWVEGSLVTAMVE